MPFLTAHACGAHSLVARVLSIKYSILFSLTSGLVSIASANVTHRVAQAYEDSVRIAVIYIDRSSECILNPPQNDADFVIDALDSSRIPNLKVIKATTDPIDNTRRISELLRTLWGDGTLPHAVVYCNGGEEDAYYVNRGCWWALENGAGFVNIGSASDMMRRLYDLEIPEWWRYRTNEFDWQWEWGRWLWQPQDSLYIVLQTGRDDFANGSVYPGLNGIVKNAAGVVAADIGHPYMLFKNIGGTGRCKADGDVYILDSAVTPKLRFMGYHHAYNANKDSSFEKNGTQYHRPPGHYGEVDEHIAVTVFRDSIETYFCKSDTNCRSDYNLRGDMYERRAVSLAFQPSTIENEKAAQQIVYDAVMYASLKHLTEQVPYVSVRTRIERKIDAHLTIAPQNGILILGTDVETRFGMKLLTMQGRVVLSSNMAQASQAVLDVSMLPPGMYLLDITGADLSRAICIQP
ncbi:MAG: hypothetical protein GF398_16530 [Chitinivibrionales bacterium]|nr:hypothetical protein [Chitinivibrionales bacterium]